MRGVYLAALVFVALLSMPALASAQSPSSDPESGSPPGVIYELPVESGRDDAAPSGGSGDGRSPRSRGGGSRSGGGARDGGGGSSGASRGSGLRGSGLGGGGSATGGTADAGQGGAGGGGAAGASSFGAGDEGSRSGDKDDESSSDDSPLRSENGFGSSSEVPGLDERTPLPAADLAESTGGLGTGSIVAIALLAAVVLAGIALGVARQARGRD